MKAEINNSGDILKDRLRGMRKTIMPSGLEERIMIKVRTRAARNRRVRVLWQILAATGTVAAVFGIAWAVLHYLGIDLSSAFSFVPEFFNGISESIKGKVPEAPSIPVQIFGGIVLVAIFYLSINGLFSGRARKKALQKEMEGRD